MPPKIKPITCAPDCDHWEYASRMKWSESSEEPSNEGVDDGDFY